MRWRILDHTGGYMCYQPEKVARITMCCCILHNICRKMKIPLDINITGHNIEDDIGAESTTESSTGASKRQEIVNTFST